MQIWIKDSVHGDIEVSELGKKLIDTPQMQRLRRLSQVPFANLVYPGANHTRFEHSLGVYHLTGKFCSYHKIEGETKELLQTYALLHDVGHTAFPHVLEGVLIEELGIDHEKAGIDIIKKSEISDILKENGISPNDLEDLLEKTISKAITGEIGTDRMDYLVRDSMYTGVAYGVIDVDRILRKQVMVNKKLLLDISGLSAAEYLLIARFMMFASVYNHKTKATASLMLEKAVRRALSDKVISAKDLLVLDDWGLAFRLLSSNRDIGRIIQDIFSRNLYKRVFEKRLKDFKNWLFLGGIKRKQALQIEKEIAEDAGVPEEDVIFFIPRPWFNKFTINIWYKNDIYNIREISLISRILNEAQWDYMHVYVLVRRDNMEKVEPHAKRVMQALEEEKL